MGKLEITYEITGFDRILYNQRPSWKNCEFSMEKENLAMLRIWEDGINNTSQIEPAENRIEQRVKSFILALEFSLGLPLKYTMKGKEIPTIIKVIKDGVIRVTVTATTFAGSEVFGIISPVEPPKEMPSLPLECEPWVLTLVEAYTFGRYVEEQFKRQYLIIEELWDEFEQEFDQTTKDIRKDLKFIRDFVSHPICNNSSVVNFVSKDLPTSILRIGCKDYVKFPRNDISHRNFVAGFEAKSREISYALVEKKILQINHGQSYSSKP